VNGVGASRYHRDSFSKSGQLGTEAGTGPRLSLDARNCAQWFARFEARCTESARGASRDEIRLLEKELEAMRRLATGEQIP
jgi:hypothetical protein